MTPEAYSTLPESVLEMIAESGLDALPKAIQLLVNAAMQLERQQHIGAEAYGIRDI